MRNDFNICDGELRGYHGDDEIVFIPDGVDTIAEEAFAYQKYITAVYIPESVKRIEQRAFAGCWKLKTVSLPSSLEFIGYNAFRDCDSMECIAFPEKIEMISYSSFANCTHLKHVQFPENLKKIQGCAFWGCDWLMEISIPDSVTEIDDRAFYNCEKLEKIVLSDNIKSISKNTFGNCNIHSVTYRGIQILADKKSPIPGKFVSDAVRLIWTKHFDTEPNILEKPVIWDLFLLNPEAEPLVSDIVQHFEALFRFLIRKNDTVRTEKILNTGKLITKENIDNLIFMAIDEKATDVQLLLMNYKNQHIGYESQEEIIRRKFEL